MSWDYKTPTVPPPVTNNFRMNTATWAGTTELYFARLNKQNVDMLPALMALKPSDLVTIRQDADSANQAKYRVAAAPVPTGTSPASGYVTVKVAHIESTGTPVANLPHSFEHQPPPALPFPTFASLTPGLEYTFTTTAGYGFTAAYNQTGADGCLNVTTHDGIDGRVNPAQVAVVVLSRVSARA